MAAEIDKIAHAGSGSGKYERDPAPDLSTIEKEAEALYPTWPFGKNSQQRLIAEQLQAAYLEGRKKSAERIAELERENKELKWQISQFYKP